MVSLEAIDVMVWKALNEFGRPVHSKELEAKTHLGYREIQYAINRLVVSGYPVGSSSTKGYYVIQQEHEWRGALEDLDSRVRELRRRRDGLFEYGRQHGWKEITQPSLFGEQVA